MNPHTHHDERQLIDEAVLPALADELHGRDELAVRFAADFIADLPARCARMHAACELEDRDELFTVALSIRASAHMVGARLLAAEADVLRGIAVSGRMEACVTQAAVVERSATDTVAELIRVVAGYHRA